MDAVNVNARVLSYLLPVERVEGYHCPPFPPPPALMVSSDAPEATDVELFMTIS